MVTTLDAQAVALGALIRGLRHERGLTLKDLAGRTGLSHPFLSQVERGRARPSFASLDAIARGLDTTQFELFALIARGDGAGGDDAAGGFEDGSVRVFAGEFDSFRPIEVHSHQLEFGPYFSHPEQEFCYILEGAVLLDLDGAVTGYEAGGAVLVPGGVPHRWRSADGRPFRQLLIKGRPRSEEHA